MYLEVPSTKSLEIVHNSIDIYSLYHILGMSLHRSRHPVIDDMYPVVGFGFVNKGIVARPVVPASTKEPHHRVINHRHDRRCCSTATHPSRVEYAFLRAAWSFLARPCYLLWKALLAESCRRRPPSSTGRPLNDVNKPSLFKFHSWQAPTPPQDWTPNSGGAGSSSGLQAIGQPPASTTTDQSKLVSNLSWQKFCLWFQGQVSGSLLAWFREYKKGRKDEGTVLGGLGIHFGHGDGGLRRGYQGSGDEYFWTTKSLTSMSCVMCWISVSGIGTSSARDWRVEKPALGRESSDSGLECTNCNKWIIACVPHSP